MLPAQPNQSLIDGLACLGALSASPQPVGVRELARQLELEPTRIQRLLGTLSHLGLAQRTPDRKYQAGPAIHILAAQSLFGSKLLRSALPHLQSLHTHGLIVAMGVLWRDDVCYLYHAEPGMDAAAALGRVGLFPAIRSGIGVALLARQADLRRFPPAHRQLLKQTRQSGYAWVTPSDNTHHHSLGIALPDDSGTAIALSGNIPGKRIDSLVAVLRQTVHAIINP
ncbi:MAG: IclR family transcriptional regulator [Phycisphaerales bacterium]